MSGTQSNKQDTPPRGGIVRLANGGTLAFDEYGDLAGRPVIFCHGWPSSRSMAQLTDEAARNHGVRIISPDRPGISGSSFQVNRTLADWPAVVGALTEHLAIERFHLLAISGGAPYAYATALAMPTRVLAVSVVSGAPPIAELTDHSGLWRLHRWMLALHRRNPATLRALFHVARPFAAARMSLRARPFLRLALQRMDAEALRDRPAFEACFESSRRAWQASVKGLIADAEIYAQPWGFRLEEIETPIRLWHGAKDRTFSCGLAEEVARRFPNCALRIVTDAGHYSLPIRYIDEILRDLIETPAVAVPCVG
ncbi:MAG: alpha/beta fold hydrolase [Chthoniobacterales bacterium]